MISIDSRTIKKGEIFIAIKGKNFDGHDFVKTAFRKGARRAIVSRRVKLPAKCEGRLRVARDTVRELGEIAKSHRMRFKIPVVAITGSSGKTTAKDMAHAILSARYKVLKNEASKNNLIGLPLTLLKLKRKHQIAVLEMGMNRPGEIARLAEIAAPCIGAITNIGHSHLEGVGTLRDVFAAKAELLRGLSRKDTAILNKDDAYLSDIRGMKCAKVYFGMEKKCSFRAENVSRKSNKWFFSLGKERFELPLLGKHNIYNALTAIAIARQFSIDFPAIRKRLRQFNQTAPMRLEFKTVRGISILDDSYNSNPSSMRCAIEALCGYDTGGKRIIVSGDMLELGAEEKAMHESAGRSIAKAPIDVLITLGKISRFTNRAARWEGMRSLYHAKSHKDAADFLTKVTRPGDAVLVKGSRAMEMEKVIKCYTTCFTP